MKTVGERIEEIVKEYCELYDSFLQDETFKDKAQSLTLHDLIMKQFIYEQAQKEVEAYIRRMQ